jgi:hypothetical protein
MWRMPRKDKTQEVLLRTIVSPAIRQRVDDLAIYTGHSVSAFVRLAIAFTDSALVLDELARFAEQNGGLTDEQERVRVEATQTMADVLATFRPRPLVPVSSN